MILKQVGIFAFGIMVGVGVTVFVFHSSSSGRMEPSAPVASPLVNGSTSATGVTPKIEARPGKIEAIDQSASAAAGIPLEEPVQEAPSPQLPPPSLEEAHAKMESIQDKVLLAAGFTKERIEWIRRRNAELYAKGKQKLEGRQPDAPPDRNAFAFAVEKDWELWNEMSEDEFVRYRQALGRLTAVPIRTVQVGSPAERAGLRAGDDILGYGGKRVYGLSQLNGLALEGTSGGSVPVEVQRNGQTLQLWIPSGPLNVESESISESAVREITALMRGRAVKRTN